MSLAGKIINFAYVAHLFCSSCEMFCSSVCRMIYFLNFCICFTGVNGVTGSIWDFVTGNVSPSSSPVLSGGSTPSISSNASGSELTRVRQELDNAKKKMKQWEESWKQVKRVC